MKGKDYNIGAKYDPSTQTDFSRMVCLIIKEKPCPAKPSGEVLYHQHNALKQGEKVFLQGKLFELESLIPGKEYLSQDMDESLIYTVRDENCPTLGQNPIYVTLVDGDGEYS